jgi:hypothetical protein
MYEFWVYDLGDSLDGTELGETGNGQSYSNLTGQRLYLREDMSDERLRYRQRVERQAH